MLTYRNGLSPLLLAVLVLVGAGFTSAVADESIPPAADSSIQIPMPTRLGSASKTDAQLFNSICGCLSKRVTIRRDAPEFQPVAWSVRTLDGRRVQPREERGGGGGGASENVVLDLAAYRPGVYLVTLKDRNGRVLARPLRVE